MLHSVNVAQIQALESVNKCMRACIIAAKHTILQVLPHDSCLHFAYCCVQLYFTFLDTCNHDCFNLARCSNCCHKNAVKTYDIALRALGAGDVEFAAGLGLSAFAAGDFGLSAGDFVDFGLSAGDLFAAPATA